MTDSVDEILDMHALIKSGDARKIRERTGLSLSAVASALEISPSTLMHWEKATRKPQGANALRYARMLQKLAAV